jgi:hypothetical protein
MQLGPLVDRTPYFFLKKIIEVESAMEDGLKIRNDDSHYNCLPLSRPAMHRQRKIECRSFSFFAFKPHTALVKVDDLLNEV